MLTELLIAAASLPIVAAQPAPAGWQINGDRLDCTYEVANFVESVALVEQIVAPAEALGHHPDIAIAYNQVSLSLTTHDAGGLSELDYQLAEAISAIAADQVPPLSCINLDE
ncbi:MAG: 4a-hydroxytetrahydrobiopterin dehydratase [Cyanobacteria bacterium P01_A01_bin.114]